MDDRIDLSLSCSNDIIHEAHAIDKSVLDLIWEKAIDLVNGEGFITPIPGAPTGKGNVVASLTSNTPHMVTVGRKNDFVFLCDKNCPRFVSYKFYQGIHEI